MSEPLVTHSDSVDIAAPPERVYELVSAMDRYGEWSSENTGGYWRKDENGNPGTGKVGDFFVGINRSGDQEWKAPVEIVENDPNRCFAFVTGGLEYNFALWKYTIEPNPGGCTLTESYELRRKTPTMEAEGQPAIDARMEAMRTSIRATLEGLKATAEAG